MVSMVCICRKEGCEEHKDVCPRSFQGILLRSGITVQEFAKETGAPASTVYSWVKGTRRTPLMALWALRKMWTEKRGERS